MDDPEPPSDSLPPGEEPNLPKGWRFLAAAGALIAWNIGYVVVSEFFGTGEMEWNSSPALIIYCAASIPLALFGLAAFLLGLENVWPFSRRRRD